MTQNDKQRLFEFLLRLGDNALILGQQLGEWVGHGPELEGQFLPLRGEPPGQDDGRPCR